MAISVDSVRAVLASYAPGHLTIDLDAVVANWQALAARLANGAVCGAAVKADAYGLGAARIAPALWGAGCRTFFVALPQEGKALRAWLPKAEIYILDGLLMGEAMAYAELRLKPVLGSWPELEEWAALNRTRDKHAPAALHVDTGMNRLGLALEEANRLARSPALGTALGVDLVMSHLACGSDPMHPMNVRQLERFRAIVPSFAPVRRSLANSAGILMSADYHFDLARPGIALYGGRAFEVGDNPMRPVLQLDVPILQVRPAAEGESIGYGAAQILRRPSQIAVVAVGYADGIPRSVGGSDAQSGAIMRLAGHDVPIVVRISMDLIALDVTDISPSVARRGALVEVFGPSNPVATYATVAGTIDYELMTHLGRRFARSYVETGRTC